MLITNFQSIRPDFCFSLVAVGCVSRLLFGAPVIHSLPGILPVE